MPPEDRVRLAEELLATVQEDAEVELAWDAEIRRRIAEIDSGTAKLIPAEEVFAEETLKRYDAAPSQEDSC